MATENNEEECVLRYPTIQIIKDERVTGERVSYCTTSGGVLELGRKLLSAAREGDTELVRDLMAQGAPFTSDWLGTSPLHLAAMNGHSETCAVLVRAGISRDCRTKVDRTALHEAAAGGHAHAVRLLLDAGADPHARDMLRMTPLHWAVEREHAHVARELLLAGADPRAMSKFLLTPLDMSAHKCPNLHTLLQKAASRQQPASTETEPEPEPVATEEHTSEPEESPGPLLWEDPPDIHDDTTQQGVEVGEVEENGNGGGGSGEGEGAALLRAHGITLLPTDDGGTALSALRNGRTLVLSDAGKLLLKENGVRLLATPTATGQVKLEPSPVTPNRRRPKTVKILVNKNHLGRLIAAAQTSNTAPQQRVASVGSVASGPNVASEVGGSSASHVVRVPEQFLRSTDPAYLRRQLLAAHASLASLRRQLARST